MRLPRFLLIRKLQKWDNYLRFVEETDLRALPPLTVGSADDLPETTPEKIFEQLPMYRQLSEKYDLPAAAGSGSDFEKTVRLMQWLTDHTLYSGASATWKADNSPEILDFAYDQDFSHAINCREKAIVLTDCLLALKVYAYPVCMLNSQGGGCHFTVHVFLREQKQWALFDPSFNCWFSKEGEPLNAWTLRDLFLAGGEPVLEGYTFNHTDKCRDVYLLAFVKQNLTNLTTWQDNSMDRRGYKKNDWNSKKEFKAKLPEWIL